MNNFYRKFVLFTIILSVFCFISSAQRSSGIAVEGKISVQEGVVEGAVIQMFQDGRRLDNYGVGADGNYKVELSYNHKYDLIFTLKGNFSQKIVVDSNVPAAVLQTNPRFPPFPVNISLFTEIPGIDRSFSENTVLKIYYSEQVDNFISDLYYNDAQIKNLIDQAILKSQMVDKEADYLSKLTKAELAEMRKEYDKLLEDAGKEYSNEQFLNALDGYKAASRIFPREQYPKDRIAEINDLLGLMMVAEELDKALAERFGKLVAEADQLFTSQRYLEANSLYNRALSIKPLDSHVNQRIQQINDMLKKQQTEQQYQDLIVRGNNAFNEMLYEEALKIYTEASGLKPGESYPKTKIEEINGKLNLLAKNAENQKSYDQAVFQAELNFEKQFYDRAITSYENALVYKPGDTKAEGRIREIRELMQGLANKTLYDKLIQAADKAFNKKLYAEALTDYTKALEVFPQEKHPAERIELINKTQNAEANFLAAVKQADEAFAEKKYQESKSFYTQALEIRAGDKHSADRIKQIDGFLALMANDDRYNNLIAEADRLLALPDYENAKAKYTESLGVKPNEKYPKDKIAEINSLLQQMAQADQKYRQTVQKADDLFNRKSYSEARPVYVEADGLKPAETYPREMIGKIDALLLDQTRILAEQQAAEQARLEALASERDRNYQQVVDEADRLVTQNELVAAVGKFRAALDIKPQEQYPIVRIEEIRGMISRLQDQQKAYETAIAKADKEFQREVFDAAKLAYNEAKTAKPDEVYPGEMIAKIDSIVDTRARLAREAAEAEAARLAAAEAEKQRQYDETIARADGLFNDKSYENARTEYRSALTVKPGEIYPQQRIDEIGNLLAQLSAAQKAYEDAVSRGDRNFRSETFDAAKLAYNEAKTAKPDEVYPGEMIAKIDSIVDTRARLAREAAEAEAARLAAAEAEKQQQYDETIARADGLFNDKSYENARTEYRSALTVKPGEIYPQQRIDEIGNLLAQLSAAQKAYEDAVSRGDRNFRSETFDAAKLAYNEAKAAKPDEVYPGEMIAKIDSIVDTRARLAREAAEAEAARLAAAEAEKQKQYDETIARADGLFNDKSYENARTEYRSALTVKPGETYPQQRIDEIGNLLAQLAAAQKELEQRNKSYNDAIRLADSYFSSKNYPVSKNNYEKASGIKPEETYPKQKITEIDSILKQQEVDENYRVIVLAADGFFRTESWTDAKTGYEKALGLKPAETYPQNQIRKIDDILQKEQERVWAAQQAAADLERRKNEIVQKNETEREAEVTSEAGLTGLYNEYIQMADSYFDGKQYNVSRAWYYKAWDVKPEETYPPQRIAEINRLVGGMLTSQRDRDYQGFVDLADSTFRINQLAVSRGWYNRALTVKPEEQYPKTQLDEIQRLINERMAGQSGQLVNSYIERAANAFETQNYNVARFWYKKALELRPDDTTVKNRLIEIEEALK